MTATTSSDYGEEVQIRSVIDRWVDAFRRKDVDAALSVHTPDVVSFDIVPPLRYRGASEYRAAWTAAFEAFDGPIVIDLFDLTITVRDDIAFSHAPQAGDRLRSRQRGTDEFRLFARSIDHERFHPNPARCAGWRWPPPGSRARLARNPPMGGQPGGSSIGVETADVLGEHARLCAIGGIDIDSEPMRTPGAPLMFMLRDPDGNHVVVVGGTAYRWLPRWQSALCKAAKPSLARSVAASALAGSVTTVCTTAAQCTGSASRSSTGTGDCSTARVRLAAGSAASWAARSASTVARKFSEHGI